MYTSIERKQRKLDLNRLLGKRLAAIRHESGIKQEQVADELNVGRPLVSKIEGGHRMLDATEVVDYAKALHVDSERLFGEIKNVVIEYDSKRGKE